MFQMGEGQQTHLLPNHAAKECCHGGQLPRGCIGERLKHGFVNLSLVRSRLIKLLGNGDEFGSIPLVVRGRQPACLSLQHTSMFSDETLYRTGQTAQTCLCLQGACHLMQHVHGNSMRPVSYLQGPNYLMQACAWLQHVHSKGMPAFLRDCNADFKRKANPRGLNAACAWQQHAPIPGRLPC